MRRRGGWAGEVTHAKDTAAGRWTMAAAGSLTTPFFIAAAAYKHWASALFKFKNRVKINLEVKFLVLEATRGIKN